MAYDEKLLDLLEDIIEPKQNIVPKKMFGGIGFLLHGNMCFGIHKNYLVVRIGIAEAEKALRKQYTKPFDITGRVMKGWVMIESKGFSTTQALTEWVDLAISFVETLPKK